MTVISKPTLQELLFNNGISDYDCPASAYALPDLDWLTNDFFPALVEDQQVKRLDRYRMGSNTCVRFSRHAAALAADLFDTSDEDAALAVGVFEFIREDGSGHMINIFAFVGEDGANQIGFFEPQPPPHVTTPIRKENSPCLAEF